MLKFVLDSERGEPRRVFNKFIGREETVSRTLYVLHILPDGDPDNEHLTPMPDRF